MLAVTIDGNSLGGGGGQSLPSWSFLSKEKDIKYCQIILDHFTCTSRGGVRSAQSSLGAKGS